jgi:predicted nucleic acid-binding protein
MRRVLVDTNVILSAVRFPNGVAAVAFWEVVSQEHLVTTEYVLAEARDVVDRKWPEHRDVLEALLAAISYDVLPLATSGVEVRDAKDQPILDAAIVAGVDVILTGDKDFHALALERPLIMTPRAYLDAG